MQRKFEQEYDRIASSRLSRLNGGVERHIALGSKNSIRLRFKLNRMGIKGDHIDDIIKLVDNIDLNQTLSNHTIGVRFATIPRSKKPLDIWKIDN